MGYRDPLKQIKGVELQSNNKISTLTPTAEQMQAKISVFLSRSLKQRSFNKQ